MPQRNQAPHPEDVYWEAMPLIRSLHSLVWAAQVGEGSEEHRLGLYSDVARATKIAHGALARLECVGMPAPVLAALHRAQAVMAALGLVASAAADSALLSGIGTAYSLDSAEYPGAALKLIDAEWDIWRDTELPERWIADAEEVAHA